MPRHPKGARLWLRPARPDGSRPAVWIIRDGPHQIGTGCGQGSLSEAEDQLAAYIASKHEPAVSRSGDPAETLVADVLALYAREKAPTQADPVSVGGWIEHLLDFPDWTTCADVKRSTCIAYVAWRIKQPRRAAKTPEARAVMVTEQTARRELEVLSAAFGHWDQEHPFTRRPTVTLPEKAESPRDALTRTQAAGLLLAAMGWRLGEDGRWRRLPKSARANRAHLRRFLLIGFYTGTRPGVIPKLLWHESPSSAYADLDAGIIYRRGKAERERRTKRRPLVRIPARLLAHMRRWRKLDERTQETRRKAQEEAGATGPRFTLSSVLHHGGEPLAGRVRRGFAGCVRDAGLPEEITPHWMRHTAATWLVEADCPPWDAAGYLGMTTATLEKCYGHHRPSHQLAARTALSRARATASPQNRPARA